MKKLAIALCLTIAFFIPAWGQDPCTQTTKLTGGTTYNTSKREKLPNSPYTYEIWTESGGGNTVTWYGPNAGGGAAFRATWNGASTDFLGRIGFHYGNGGTYSSYNYVYADYNYTRSGNNTGGSYSYIGLYGWTANSVVEWYIVEDWYGSGILSSSGILGTYKGDFTASTGATYKIYRNTRPAGSGCVGCNNQAFPQYFSVRQRANSDPSKPMCGTVYVQEHFEAFEKYSDMKMGTSMYEISWLNESAARNTTGWYELSYLSLTKENQKRSNTGGTPSSNSGGGTSSSSGSATTEPQECGEYQTSFCGGLAYGSVLSNSTAIPSVGSCLYIGDFEVIQPALSATVAINGVENTCGADWDNCPYNDKPAAKDGGYYVYVKTGSINSYEDNGWQGIEAKAKPDCSTSPTILKTQLSSIKHQNPVYYSLRGEPLGNAKPQKSGIYIVKEGFSVKKIVVK